MLKESNLLDERVPVEVGTIQVNFCQNQQYQNFAFRLADSGNAVRIGKGQDNY